MKPFVSKGRSEGQRKRIAWAPDDNRYLVALYRFRSAGIWKLEPLQTLKQRVSVRIYIRLQLERMQLVKLRSVSLF